MEREQTAFPALKMEKKKIRNINQTRGAISKKKKRHKCHLRRTWPKSTVQAEPRGLPATPALLKSHFLLSPEGADGLGRWVLREIFIPEPRFAKGKHQEPGKSGNILYPSVCLEHPRVRGWSGDVIPQSCPVLPIPPGWHSTNPHQYKYNYISHDILPSVAIRLGMRNDLEKSSGSCSSCPERIRCSALTLLFMGTVPHHPIIFKWEPCAGCSRLQARPHQLLGWWNPSHLFVKSKKSA